MGADRRLESVRLLLSFLFRAIGSVGFLMFVQEKNSTQRKNNCTNEYQLQMWLYLSSDCHSFPRVSSKCTLLEEPNISLAGFIGRDGRLRDQLGAESGVLRRARLLSKWSGGEGWGEGQCEVLGHKGT